MKRFGYVILFVCGLFGFASCSEELKTCSGKVSSFDADQLILEIGDYSIDFNLANLANSDAIMPGDSVIVEYVGDLKEKHADAFGIKLITKQGTFIDNKVDYSKVLLIDSVPMTPEQIKSMEASVKLLEQKMNQK